MNVGEEICGEWLRLKRDCAFVQHNLKLPKQGEIDVVGVNVAEKIVYGCEVAVHVCGLQYVNPVIKRPENANRFKRKFEKDFSYLRERFPEYAYVLMLWSPIERDMVAIREIEGWVKHTLNADLQVVVNREFQKVMTELREIASGQTQELHGVMRLFQIEEHLKRHVARMERKTVKL